MAVAVVLATVVISIGAYARAGRQAVEVLAVNLPDAPASSGLGLLQQTHLGPQASSFDVTFALSAAEGEGIWRLPPEARVEVQVETGGRTLRLGISDPSRAGEERAVTVSDRAWVDLGPVGSSLAPRTARVRALDDSRFSLLRPIRSTQPDLRQVEVRVADGSKPTGAQGPPRYRIVADRPVPARESVARLLAFPAMSRLVSAALAFGLLATLAGVWLVFRHPVAGAALAVAGVALTHAALRPPLHGEDESSHVGTVEFAVLNPDQLKGTSWWRSFPASIEKLGSTLDLDRVQYRDTQALPLDSPGRRLEVAGTLRKPFTELARSSKGTLPSAVTLDVGARAPLYYDAFVPLRPVLSRLGLLERVSAYRLLSTGLAGVAFLSGLLLLAWGFPSRGVVLLFALAALLPPYLMSLLTTVTNYSLAIGFGQLIAAALVTTVASERHRARVAGSAVLLAATVAGMGVYRDFAGLVPAALLLALVAGPAVAAVWAWRRDGAIRWAGVAAAVAVPAGAAYLLVTELVSRPDRIGKLVAFVAARRPRGLPDPADPVWPYVAQVVLAPLAVGLVLALLGLLGLLGRRLGEKTATRLAIARSGLGAALFLALFIAIDFVPIPVETTRLEFRQEVLAFWNAFWSTNFSFDQDVLSWKMYWGVFGWADTRYPALAYAIGRWLCVALFVALPVLCRKTQRERPLASALLLVFSGLAMTLAFASNTARYFIPVNPWGRFILPWVPLALFSALARIDLDGKREEILKWLLVAAVSFHLWTAIYVLGVRYYIPR